MKRHSFLLLVVSVAVFACAQKCNAMYRNFTYPGGMLSEYEESRTCNNQTSLQPNDYPSLHPNFAPEPRNPFSNKKDVPPILLLGPHELQSTRPEVNPQLPPPRHQQQQVQEQLPPGYREQITFFVDYSTLLNRQAQQNRNQDTHPEDRPVMTREEQQRRQHPDMNDYLRACEKEFTKRK